MKFINKLIAIALLMVVVSACERFDMDQLDNPNAVTPDKASLNDLYNSVQLNFGSVFMGSEYHPGAAARMYHAGSFTYQAFSTPNTFNGAWNTMYAGLMPDVSVLTTNFSEGFDVHTGTAKIMQGYSMMMMVDLFNDVPYSEAGQGTDIISPLPDAGSDVYNAAIALIDDGIADLTGTVAAPPTNDLFYGGDVAKWITAGNTLKLRAALNMGDASAFNAIISGGDFIDEAGEDFAAQFGSQRLNPNSRHPRYNNMYESGDGDYLSNYYMWLLKGDKEDVNGVTIVDPRIRYYFYRKVSDSYNQDPTTFSCHFSVLPDQTSKPTFWNAIDPDLPYCIASTDGYSGRDHLNGEGTPPDGPVKTSYGLYPFGGDFDDDSFEDTRTRGVKGGLGEGILPMMLSFYVDFMRAEAALTMGTSDDARAMLSKGIMASLDKVESFESLVSGKMATSVTLRDGSSGTIKGLYGMDADAKTAYHDAVLALYDAANAAGKLDIVMKEFYIATWGNGLEAYNIYRRTGLPANMQPSLEPDPGQFPNSFYLPIDHISRNSKTDQKTLADRVFWNANGPDNY